MVNNVNGVFYATTYDPIQAGSIDGTDITAHDNGVYRALLGSATGLYDPLGDPKAEGDPYCSLFVGRLSAQTDEKSLREAMSKYGRVKNLRLVRHIVTGASCGYAFVEFETEKDMRFAYEGAHLSKLDGACILVDYNRQQLMSGWIPRRLGGGLGGKKESGQLRFGGRDRPFRAPLRPIPHEELRKLGIPLPPEGRYMNRFQVPLPPHRRQSITSEYGSSSKISESKQHRVHSMEEYDLSVKDKDSLEAHGSEVEEVRERDRHRRRRDDFSDRVDGDYHETESRSYRKHRTEERGQESRRESKYEGYELEPKRVDSTSHRDQRKSEERREERVDRKRRKEQSPAHYEYDEEDRKRHRRRHSQDDREHSAERSERRNRNLDYHTERSSEQREPEPEQSRNSRNPELGDAHGRHRESRYRSEDQSDYRPPTRENEKKHRHSESKHRTSESKHRTSESKHRSSESKHRHSESKHRRRDREQGSPNEDEGKHQRSSRKHKHRERSAGENIDFEEKEK
ncbi:hypothetical protein KC19_4G092900 [Ceratodon purpureus]|uniref:RRM domain-containing protein n=1 Tax=Ceratodon purpureus TaxID=3225 RepID=A0A8T0I8P6_CERPU|nr:hypothetical protein KC19_4G092900 [Ceratodon purpureus]KAG0579355.1 hypothetical protein KC19_4G092900 [Ceratodon purpureus]